MLFIKYCQILIGGLIGGYILRSAPPILQYHLFLKAADYYVQINFVKLRHCASMKEEHGWGEA